jgi:hypothetical protein
MKTKGPKVVRIPVSLDRRRRNLAGPGYVPCMLSDRWIRFPKQSDGHFGPGEFISIAVMSGPPGENPRKLCELTVTREDLVRALDSVAAPEAKA